MQLTLTPETAQFIDDQVKAGRFPSAEALVEAAVAEFRETDGTGLDADAIAAIHEGLDQADRGEGVELDEFRKQFFKRRTGN